VVTADDLPAALHQSVFEMSLEMREEEVSSGLRQLPQE
jgi:hypothetical protein